MANPYQKPHTLYLRLINLIYQSDMTVVEVCSGTGPAARACSILGLNSISFDFREEQNETALSLLNQYFSEFNEKPVCIFKYKILSYITNISRILVRF